MVAIGHSGAILISNKTSFGRISDLGQLTIQPQN